MSDEQQPLTTLSPELVVRILQQAGSKRITVEAVQSHLAAGAPTNSDGTLSLIAYTAWLVQEVAHGA